MSVLSLNMSTENLEMIWFVNYLHFGRIEQKKSVDNFIGIEMEDKIVSLCLDFLFIPKLSV